MDVLDKACVEECPVDCIYEGGRMLYIQPDECVDCGACEPVCPVEAIFYEDDVPDEWEPYTAANVDFFDDLGSPGGASKVGKTDYDRRSSGGLRPWRGLRPGWADVGSVRPCRTSRGTRSRARADGGRPSRRAHRPFGGHSGGRGRPADP